MTRAFLILPLCLAFVVHGCNSSTDKWKKDRPKVIPVSVTVTYNGQKVEGAKVYFSLQEGSAGAIAETRSDGIARMTTFEEGDGVVPGTHLVKISKVLVETTIGTEKLPDSDDYPVTVKRESLLPEKYSNYASSGLSVTATKDGPNDFKFDLTD